MTITTIVPKRALDNALAQAGRALPKNAGVPALANVLLKNGYAVCNDLELCIMSRFVETNEEYEMLLPPKIIPICKAMQGDTITITAEPGKKAVITDGATRVTLPVFLAEEFPCPTTGDGDLIAEIKSCIIKDLAAKTLPAVSTEWHRPAFTGVRFDFFDHSMTAAASDTYRLSMYRAAAEVQTQPRFVLPARGLREAARMTGDTIRLFSVGNTVAFTDENANNTVISSLIEEKFPDFSRVIPEQTETTLTKRDDLLRVLNLCRLVGDVASIHISAENISIQAVGETGKVEDTIACDGTTDLQLKLNARFLAEGLAMAVDEPEIHTSGDDKPVMIKQKDWTYLVLPIKLDD